MNHKPEQPFWETKKLSEMSSVEWESLCDGCAKCCLVQLEDEQLGQLVFTDVACNFLDDKACQCTDYSSRSTIMPSCMSMTVDNVAECAEFAPQTCAYRLLLESKPLPEWHHLVCGDRDEIHRRGLSVQSKVRFVRDVEEENYENYVVDWPK